MTGDKAIYHAGKRIAELISNLAGAVSRNLGANQRAGSLRLRHRAIQSHFDACLGWSATQRSNLNTYLRDGYQGSKPSLDQLELVMCNASGSFVTNYPGPHGKPRDFCDLREVPHANFTRGNEEVWRGALDAAGYGDFQENAKAVRDQLKSGTYQFEPNSKDGAGPAAQAEPPRSDSKSSLAVASQSPAPKPTLYLPNVVAMDCRPELVNDPTAGVPIRASVSFLADGEELRGDGFKIVLDACWIELNLNLSTSIQSEAEAEHNALQCKHRLRQQRKLQLPRQARWRLDDANGEPCFGDYDFHIARVFGDFDAEDRIDLQAEAHSFKPIFEAGRNPFDEQQEPDKSAVIQTLLKYYKLPKVENRMETYILAHQRLV